MAFYGRPHVAVGLLIIVLSSSAHAAVINRKAHKAKQSKRLRALYSEDKESLAAMKNSVESLSLLGAEGMLAALQPKETVEEAIFPTQQPGLIGIMHEGSKMGLPMSQAVPVQVTWPVPTLHEKMILASTIPYACFSIFMAFLYYQARDQYPKTFMPQPAEGILPRASGFSFDLFSCLSDPRVCVMGFCCPCLRWADTLDKYGVMSYWAAFMLMLFSSLMIFYTNGVSILCVALLGVVCRQKLRAQFEMDNKTVNTVLMDVWIWLCCQPCAIIQEAREQAVQRGGNDAISCVQRERLNRTTNLSVPQGGQRGGTEGV